MKKLVLMFGLILLLGAWTHGKQVGGTSLLVLNNGDGLALNNSDQLVIP